MTHFHYYEDEAMHCNRWFCPLENRVEEIMEAVYEIEAFKKRAPAPEQTDETTRVASKSIVETDQKSYQLLVPKSATKAEVRTALYELAVFRWHLYGDSKDLNDLEPRELEGLPPIFSYLDEDDNTIYFFNDLYTAIPRGWNEVTHPHVIWTNEFPDNKVKIPVTKLPTVAAKKLFNRD